MEDRSDLYDLLYAGLPSAEKAEVAASIRDATAKKLRYKRAQGDPDDRGDILDRRRAGLADWATDLAWREHAVVGAGTTPEQLDAFAAEHDQLADARDRLAEAQDAAAAERDEAAERSDLQACLRDRDRADDGPIADGAANFLDRHGAAVDRDRAATDRLSAATERLRASRDRRHSAADRTRAAEARLSAAQLRDERPPEA